MWPGRVAVWAFARTFTLTLLLYQHKSSSSSIRGAGALQLKNEVEKHDGDDNVNDDVKERNYGRDVQPTPFLMRNRNRQHDALRRHRVPLLGLGAGGNKTATDGEAATALFLEQQALPPVDYACAKWADPIEAKKCGFKAQDGLSCEEKTLSLAKNAPDSEKKYKVYTFGPGTFGIDRQILVPENTILQGHADPNIHTINGVDRDSAKKLSFVTDRDVKPFEAADFKAGSGKQTLILATKAVNLSLYCKATKNIKNVRIGFVMSSNTVARNLNYQGIDKGRPGDDGTLCGGGIFETKGCNQDKCALNAANNADSDGLPVQNVLVENIRINDVLSTQDGTRKPDFGAYSLQHFRDNVANVNSAQVVFWLAENRGANNEMTKNVIVRNVIAYSLHADGLNVHSKGDHVLIENVHIQNSGDDGFAVWGGLEATKTGSSKNVAFKDCEMVNPGVLRSGDPYAYGNCAAFYGLGGRAVLHNFRCVTPTYTKGGVTKNHGSWWKQFMSLATMITIRGEPYFQGYYSVGAEIHVGNYELLQLDGKTKHTPGQAPPNGLTFSPSDDGVPKAAFSKDVWDPKHPLKVYFKEKNLGEELLYGEGQEKTWFGLLARSGPWGADEAINGPRKPGVAGAPSTATSAGATPAGTPAGASPGAAPVPGTDPGQGTQTLRSDNKPSACCGGGAGGGGSGSGSAPAEVPASVAPSASGTGVGAVAGGAPAGAAPAEVPASVAPAGR